MKMYKKLKKVTFQLVEKGRYIELINSLITDKAFLSPKNIEL